jgi:hypothetical protein
LHAPVGERFDVIKHALLPSRGDDRLDGAALCEFVQAFAKHLNQFVPVVLVVWSPVSAERIEVERVLTRLFVMANSYLVVNAGQFDEVIAGLVALIGEEGLRLDQLCAEVFGGSPQIGDLFDADWRRC